MDIVINDLHIPYHDKEAVRLVKTFIYDTQPEALFINGDLLDMFEISKYSDEGGKPVSLIEEIEQGKAFLSELRNNLPDTRIVYIFGNHEHRFQTYLSHNAPKLMGLQGMRLREQLECDRLDVEVCYSKKRESYIKHRGVLIGHFDKVNKHSAYTAKNLLDSYGYTLIQGHTHRGGSHFRTHLGTQVASYENFCLCDMEDTWLLNPNWQHGFSVIDYINRKPYIIQLPIVEKKFKFNGREYKGESS